MTQTLLEQLKNGETEALDALMETYTPYVLSVLRRRLGRFSQPEDLEELASNVFFALWQHRKRLRSDHLRAWLGTVAANEARSWLRRQRLETLPADDLLELPDECASRLADDTERRLLAAQALALLDNETREIFRRYYTQCQTVAQIAVQMKLNVSTVKSRLRRGRARLREALGEQAQSK